VGELYPELFSTPLSPKSDEIVAYTNGGGIEDAKKRFEEMITRAFAEIRRVLKPDGVTVIVFAYPKTDAWESIIKALLNAGIYLTGSWPIHTEMQSRLRAQESAALASSIYMICRKRITSEAADYPRVRREIEERVREKLDKFWQEGIRGADFFMSAIGPAVEVFGRYERVEKLSGERVEVKELLEYVRQVVSEYALERILGSAELGGVDPETRFYLLWRWTYNNARVPFDEARKLATAVGTELTELWNSGNLVSKEKEYVRVLGPKDREKDAKFMRQERFNTMVDTLHRAVLYWERSERQKLKDHLSQTHGANDMFWRVAQNIADVLPDNDKEKQLLQGLLYGSKAHVAEAPATGKLFE
jgi:adenine-specific DNA methylase